MDAVVIGAGPAGLSAAYELSKAGRSVVVLEKDPTYVGGLSRTVEHNGFRCDVGGHRFFSKNPEIEAFWTEMLAGRMLEVQRLSRIYYRKQFFKYPIEVADTLRRLGLYEAAACGLSYARARVAPIAKVESFEDWVVNAFGRRLFEIFFKTYTEKVWGVPCSEISADWAAQRIRGLSFATLIRSMVTPKRRTGKAMIKTLTDRFRYPARGPGEMWEEVARRVVELGSEIRMGEGVVRIRHASGRVTSVATGTGSGEAVHSGTDYISTMALRDLLLSFDPQPPERVIEAAHGLRYRDFLVVALVVPSAHLFPDQWIYVHDPEVLVGRIQNFKNWSSFMVPDQETSFLGFEYFCAEGDNIWAATDEALFRRAEEDLAALRLAPGLKAAGGIVVRQSKAYPVYDQDYQAKVLTIRDYLQHSASNLQVVGRNGMHKYNNQDHAMLTGLLAARNILGGSHDVWLVNSDAEYLEEDSSRMTPRPLTAAAAD